MTDSVLLQNLAVLLCETIDFGLHCSAFRDEKYIHFVVSAFVLGIRVVHGKRTALGLECVRRLCRYLYQIVLCILKRLICFPFLFAYLPLAKPRDEVSIYVIFRFNYAVFWTISIPNDNVVYARLLSCMSENMVKHVFHILYCSGRGYLESVAKGLA